jgi:hypothetical protein
MLTQFQKSVIGVAIFIAFILLIIIAIQFFLMKKDFVFPPVIPSCPDFWEDVSIKENGSRCSNVNKLGSCNNTIMDFTKSHWIGGNGLCHKKRWATACGLTWDGVTNRNHCG